MSESEEAGRHEVGAESRVAERERLDALRRSIEDAELELKLAQTRLERAKLDGEAERARRPWWRNWNVAALTAIIAATAPVTAGVVGYFERQKQLALAEQQQKQESARNSERQLEDIRSHYLDRVRNPGERRRTLRFIIVASNDPKLQQWARGEVPIVDAEAKRIDEEIAAKEQIAAASEAAYVAALNKERDPNVRLTHLKKLAVNARQLADQSRDPAASDSGQPPAGPAALDALRYQADADRARASAAGGGGLSPKFPISAGLVPGL